MKLLFSICSLLLFKFSFSQNLLVNGGFEDENTCTEFHVTCAPEGWISTADTYNSFFKIPRLAHSGLHCFAIEAGNSRKVFMRTYMRSQLLCGLRKGNKYKIEFYIRSKHPILDSVGIYFTPYDFLFEKAIRYKINPSVYLANAIQKPIKGDTNWQRVFIEYTATGNEEYITLGNFSKRDITGPTGISLENNFFVYFDDISLTPSNPREKLCDDWQRTKQDIYSFDARHNFLDLYIRKYIKNPPEPPGIDKTVVQVVDTLILPDVLFQVDESELTRKSFHVLDSLCAAAIKRKIDSLVIEGHTDNTGSLTHNEKLSIDRALSVADYVGQKLFLNKQFIITRGWASRKPVADNRTFEGRQMNRRVEIFVYIRE